MKTETAQNRKNAEAQRMQSGARAVPRPQRVANEQDVRKVQRRHHCGVLRAGTARAPLFASLLLCVFALMPLGLSAATNDLSGLLQRGLFEEEANRNLDAAAQAYQTVSAQFDKDRKLAATAIFRLGEVYRKQGKTNEAVGQYERIVREFADQSTLVTLSRQNLAGLGAQKTETAETATTSLETVLTPEAVELERTQRILAQLDGWDLSQLRRLIPVHIPDAEFERINELLTISEKTDGQVSDEIRMMRDKWREQLSKRSVVIMTMLRHRVALLEEVVKQQGPTNRSTARPDDGRSPVTTVLDEEEAEIRRIQAMIQNSPDLINAQSGDPSMTPLSRSASKGQLRVAEFLLAHGADVNLNLPLSQAAGGGHKAMVELLLKHGASVNAAIGQGRTALYRAAERGFLTVTEALLNAKANPNLRDDTHRTALTVAVEKGFVPAAAALLAHGADPNIVCRSHYPGQFDRTTDGAPIHFAVARIGETMVALLLTNRADLTLRNPLGESALDIAAILGRTSIARQLIAAGADVNASDPIYNGGATLLHHACSAGHRDVVALLLEHGANPNVTAVIGQAGVTPLMNAAGKGNEEIVSLLLKNKADPNLVDAKDNTALLNAINARATKAVRALLSAGAHPDTRTSYGGTALISAVADQRDKALTSALIEAKANVNAPSSDGKTPLHHAAMINRKDLVELLVAAGADPNLRDKSGKTPLDYTKPSPIPTATAAALPPGVIPPPHSQGEPAVKPADIAALLRQHGALDDLPDFNSIGVGRTASGFRAVVFSPGTNDWSHYTLVELLAKSWGLIRTDLSASSQRSVRSDLIPENVWRSNPLRFPDLTQITIHRPTKDGKSRAALLVNLYDALSKKERAGDVLLQPGDVVEVPEADHPVNEVWAGLVGPDFVSISNCLARTLTVKVGGKATALTLAPIIEQLSPTPGQRLVNMTSPSFMLRAVLDDSKLLRFSSDLTRVKVIRKDGPNGKPQEWVVDCSGGTRAYPDLWVRDGDVIEVPDKQ